MDDIGDIDSGSATENINGSKTVFRPGVNGDMRCGNLGNATDALWLKPMYKVDPFVKTTRSPK